MFRLMFLSLLRTSRGEKFPLLFLELGYFVTNIGITGLYCFSVNPAFHRSFQNITFASMTPRRHRSISAPPGRASVPSMKWPRPWGSRRWRSSPRWRRRSAPPSRRGWITSSTCRTAAGGTGPRRGTPVARLRGHCGGQFRLCRHRRRRCHPGRAVRGQQAGQAGGLHPGGHEPQPRQRKGPQAG